jgi:hypothetical protein
MRRECWQSVLCVGNGLSGEAAALADAGFAVTALDRSPFAVAHAPPAAPESPPFAAYFGQACSRAGGSLRVVHGDLFDPQVCPGPFDVIIERRTLQLWSRLEPVVDGDDCDRGLAAVTARLADASLFVSHQHIGCWRPGQSRQHFAQRWLAARGFPIALDAAPSEPAPEEDGYIEECEKGDRVAPFVHVRRSTKIRRAISEVLVVNRDI